MAREGLVKVSTTSLITSLDNPRVRRARKLTRRSVRHDEGAFLVEGSFFVLEAMRSDQHISDLFVTEDVGGADEVFQEAAERDVRPLVVSQQVMRSMSDAATPQGVVAIVEMPEQGTLPDSDLYLVLASVRDPGNAGTLIRSAVAAGAGAVIFSGGSVDPYSPKTVRSSAGNLFKIPIMMSDSLEWVGRLKERGVVLVGTDARAETSMYESDLVAASAVVVGNEAWGLPDEIEDVLDVIVTIPMPGPVESLNASIAGSVLLFEAVRQRRLGSAHDG